MKFALLLICALAAWIILGAALDWFATHAYFTVMLGAVTWLWRESVVSAKFAEMQSQIKKGEEAQMNLNALKWAFELENKDAEAESLEDKIAEEENRQQTEWCKFQSEWKPSNLQKLIAGLSNRNDSGPSPTDLCRAEFCKRFDSRLPVLRARCWALLEIKRLRIAANLPK